LHKIALASFLLNKFIRSRPAADFHSLQRRLSHQNMRRKFMSINTKIVRNQKGQGVMEYIMLTALVGIFCLAAVKKVGKSMNTRLDQINKKVIQEIKIN
jgi:Flp pilus assembly pilin Flp